MYFVKYGKEYLHDPRTEDLKLFDLSLDCEQNTCGFCDFTMYSNHPMYDKLQERDSKNQIEVYDDDILLFAGYIHELGKEFYLDGHVKCKGELSYLSETIVRPYSTIQRGWGTTAPASVDGYFVWLIEQHNAQVGPEKQFKIGLNQGANLDSNNYIYRENDQYPNTFNEIEEKILSIIGGYLRIRHEDGVRYIDLLSEWTDTNSQVFDFGINLTDYTQTDDSADVVTFVVPTGAPFRDTEYPYYNGYYVTQDITVNPEKEYYTKTEEGHYTSCYNLTSFESGVTYYEYDEYLDESDCVITIDSIDDGECVYPGFYKKGDYIFNHDAVTKYGWIGSSYSNTDITEKENLITAAIVYLKELMSPKRTIEIKAVDMHFVNPDIKPIRVGEYVRIRSNPHNFDSYLLCTKIDLNLNNPEDSLYTLGTTFDTLTGEQNRRIRALNAAVNKQYEAASKLSEEAKKAAIDLTSKVSQMKGTFAYIQSEMDEAICALYESTLTLEESTSELETRTDETDDAICNLYENLLLLQDEGGEEL